MTRLSDDPQIVWDATIAFNRWYSNTDGPEAETLILAAIQPHVDRLIAEAVAKALADERAKNQTCPFDIVDCNIAPDEPCPICGDLGGINDEESGNCIAIRARASP